MTSGLGYGTIYRMIPDATLQAAWPNRNRIRLILLVTCVLSVSGCTRAVVRMLQKRPPTTTEYSSGTDTRDIATYLVTDYKTYVADNGLRAFATGSLHAERYTAEYRIKRSRQKSWHYSDSKMEYVPSYGSWRTIEETEVSRSEPNTGPAPEVEISADLILVTGDLAQHLASSSGTTGADGKFQLELKLDPSDKTRIVVLAPRAESSDQHHPNTRLDFHIGRDVVPIEVPDCIAVEQ